MSRTTFSMYFRILYSFAQDTFVQISVQKFTNSRLIIIMETARATYRLIISIEFKHKVVWSICAIYADAQNASDTLFC